MDFHPWRPITYYFKYCFFLLWMLLSTLIIPLMYRKPGHYTNKLILFYFFEIVDKILGIRWILKGKENIMKEGGSIVLMNHQSILDTLAIRQLTKPKVFTHFVTKKEVWYFLPLAVVFWRCGSIFIDRSKKKEAIETMNKLSQAISKDKNRLVIFPEGTRNSGDGFLPFKKGAFYTAISAQAPIQPVVIGKYKFLDHGKHKFDAGEAIISILPPIPTTGLKKEDVSYLVQKTTEIMLKEYMALNKCN